MHGARSIGILLFHVMLHIDCGQQLIKPFKQILSGGENVLSIYSQYMQHQYRSK